MSGKKENPVKRFFVAVLGNARYQPYTVPLFAILCSLLAASVVILLAGRNPLHAFYSLLQGAGVLPKEVYTPGKGMITDFMTMLGALTPMLFAALAVAVAFKAGLFNIGVSGQMLLAGYAATVLVGYSKLPTIAAKPLVLVVGMVAGALVGSLIGFLKYRFNINEVVSSIMLNYIIQYVLSYFILTRHIDPVTRQSRAIQSTARLTLTNVEIGGYRLDLPVFFVLAVVCAIFLKFVLDKTQLGFELRTTGFNREAARYAGMRVGKNLVVAMMISGAFSGLAGVTYYLGYYNSIIPKTLSNIGFDAIAVSLLGNSNPIGIIFASLLITIISRGSTYMSSAVGVRQEIASVITGLILLFSACGAYVVYLVNRVKAERVQAQNVDDAAAEGGDR